MLAVGWRPMNLVRRISDGEVRDHFKARMMMGEEGGLRNGDKVERERARHRAAVFVGEEGGKASICLSLCIVSRRGSNFDGIRLRTGIEKSSENLRFLGSALDSRERLWYFLL